MSTLAVYLSRMLLARFALLLFGLTAFLLALDLMANGNSILAKGDGADALLRYVALRSPIVVSDLIKISCLLAGLLTFASLIRHNELTAIWDAGVSQFGLFLRLLPLGVLLGGLQFAVNDLAVPVGVEGLRQWGIGDYGRPQDSDTTEGVTWIHVGTDIVRVPDTNIGESSLSDFIIFERDAAGTLLARLDVASARYVDGLWVLSDITLRSGDGSRLRSEARREWRIDLDPKSLQLLSAHPRHLAFDQIRRFANGDGQGTWAPYLYQTWLYEKLSACLVPLLMLLLSAALAQQSQRAGRVGLLFLGGITIGFAFFILNGVAVAMGEVGLVPPLLASASPVLAFTAAATSVIYWHELKHRPE